MHNINYACPNNIAEQGTTNQISANHQQKNEYNKNTKQNIFYLTKDKLKSILLQSKEYPYLNAFILGDTSYLSEDIKNSYLTNGISHLFSVSGMHVGFLSSIILFLLNKISKKGFY